MSSISRRRFVVAAAMTASMGLAACSQESQTDEASGQEGQGEASSTDNSQSQGVTDDRLTAARAQIDAVNAALVPLLEARLDAVCEVMEYKLAHNMDVLDASREAAVLEAVGAKTQNPEYKEAIQSIFQAIMDVTKDYERQHMGAAG